MISLSERDRVKAAVVCFALAVVMGFMPNAVRSASAAAGTITSAGPLTRIAISPTLNCTVNHSGDDSDEWYTSGSQPDACGTFVAAGGKIFGPAQVPAGSNVTGAPNYVAFTPTSQAGPTGSGTSADPYKIVTVVSLGSTGLQLTETDSYVQGQETYRTDVALASSGAAVPVVIYRAGDCYLQDSDSGYGAHDVSSGSVTCVGEDANGARGTRIEQLRPLSPGSKSMEAGYSQVWSAIATGNPFTDTCACADTDSIDNGEGLSWVATVPANGSTTVSSLAVFSPLGVQPLSTSKAADAATVTGGANDGYTITVSNPNAATATLTSITDTLPAGFTYVAGSSSGATSANPTVDNQNLTWSGSFPVPASGSITLHFTVKVPMTAGTYYNNAGGTATDNNTVIATGATAPVTVTATSTSSTTPTPTSSTTPTTSSTTPTTSSTTSTSTTSTSTTSTSTSTTSTSTTSTSAPTGVNPTAVANPNRVAAGQTTVVSGINFPGNTTLVLTLHSDPVVVGTVTSNSDGSYALQVTIPSGTTAGSHTIVVSGGGKQASAPLVVTSTSVLSTGVLSRTGTNAFPLAPLGALVFALGGVLLLVAGANAPAGAHFRRR